MRTIAISDVTMPLFPRAELTAYKNRETGASLSPGFLIFCAPAGAPRRFTPFGIPCFAPNLAANLL